MAFVPFLPIVSKFVVFVPFVLFVPIVLFVPFVSFVTFVLHIPMLIPSRNFVPFVPRFVPNVLFVPFVSRFAPFVPIASFMLVCLLCAFCVPCVCVVCFRCAIYFNLSCCSPFCPLSFFLVMYCFINLFLLTISSIEWVQTEIYAFTIELCVIVSRDKM